MKGSRAGKARGKFFRVIYRLLAGQELNRLPPPSRAAGRSCSWPWPVCGDGCRSCVQHVPGDTIPSAHLGYLPCFVCVLLAQAALEWDGWGAELCEGPSSPGAAPGHALHQMGQRNQKQRRRFSPLASGPSWFVLSFFVVLLHTIGRIAASTLLRNRGVVSDATSL